MERLSRDDDAQQWAIHTHRYQVAASFIHEDDVVLDAACGIGYGREILPGEWIGADRFDGGATHVVDLHSWVPDFPYDVFVGLETIEHLDPLDAYLAMAKRARTIVISTPIIPTKHFNPHHLQDFTKESLEELFGDREIIHYEPQVDPVLGYETYGIWVFE